MFVTVQLVGVDVMAALDLYAERGQWEKCLETASKQVHCTRLVYCSFIYMIYRVCNTEKSELLYSLTQPEPSETSFLSFL